MFSITMLPDSFFTAEIYLGLGVNSKGLQTFPKLAGVNPRLRVPTPELLHPNIYLPGPPKYVE